MYKNTLKWRGLHANTLTSHLLFLCISGISTQINVHPTDMPSPLAADIAEHGPSCSEPVSRDCFRSAFEHWPVVKQRMMQSPPHNAFPQRPSFLPFPFKDCHEDRRSVITDLNNNLDHLVSFPSPFLPSTSNQSSAFSRNRASDFPIFALPVSPLSPNSSKCESVFLRNSFNMYSSYARFGYTTDSLIQRKHMPAFHPYTVPTDSRLTDWKFGHGNKPDTLLPELKTPPVKPINKQLSPSVPRSPLAVSNSLALLT